MSKKIAVDITMIIEIPDDFNDDNFQTMKVKDISFEYVIAGQTFDVHQTKVLHSEILDLDYISDSDLITFIGKG